MVTAAWKKVLEPFHTFIIAEAGVNHNGKLDLAKKLVNIAVKAGADAVKFQTFKTENIITKEAPKANYQKQTTGGQESQFTMLKKLELGLRDYEILFEYCQKNKIIFLSTPFDQESVDFLDDLGVEIFKVPSGELINLPLIDYIARKQKPMIVSTGMANLDEVKDAVEIIVKARNKNFALLHCVSSYPADPKEVNLKAMQAMEKEFEVPVGFSDHTAGIVTSANAVFMGAKIIEKHFTIDKTLSGPDHRFSLNGTELKTMIDLIRGVELAIQGTGEKIPTTNEMETAKVVRKSLVAARDIKAGTILTGDSIAIKRPGTGLPPAYKPDLIGKKARTDIPCDKLLELEMFQ